MSSDYDATDKSTQMFFAETQNKLLYAVTHLTAAEIIIQRAQAELPNFGATSWAGSVVRKGDIFIAKNFLSRDEIDSLNRLVMIFLESAELRIKNRHILTMDFWRNNVNQLLEFNGFEILNNTGSISNNEMKEIVSERYEEFNHRRKAEAAKQADWEDLQELKQLEESITARQKEQ